MRQALQTEKVICLCRPNLYLDRKGASGEADAQVGTPTHIPYSESTISSVTSKELVFVQAVWRHGDRAPLELPYPKDPYTESAWQRGWKQLTNIGMNQHNELGRYFRFTYNLFVSKVYNPSEVLYIFQVYIRSSDSDRAITSAQAFTSGFYPANGSFQWRAGNPWQPIPIHATSPGEPDLLAEPTSTSCKKYDNLVDAEDHEQAKRYNVQYSEMFKILGEGTGIANFSYKNIDKIYDVSRELIGGYLLNNFVSNAKKVANGSMENPKKMLLYSSIKPSAEGFWGYMRRDRVKFGKAALRQWKRKQYIGWPRSRFRPPEGTESDPPVGECARPGFDDTSRMHDGTLLALMYAMGVGNNLMIPYASAVIMEIFKEGNEYQVELFFRNETTRAPYPLMIPSCGSPCTVGNMAKKYQSMLLSSYADQQKGQPGESKEAPECDEMSDEIPYALATSTENTLPRQS
ncbi:histidine acid phosphatase [Teladorsagia circumcincta]|uniref:Histidine acid phosphatase n=1 Tax=Teladorsagia circumcincta TaxID=45464 RepID=A0A2G9TYI9_TELCI|nr:histidine acid phosphatase [Teladorsagia circumcincta]